jgi:hypothetical protein
MSVSEYQKTFTLAELAAWQARFCAALRGNGSGVGALVAQDGAIGAADTLTLNEFNAALANGTIDDLIKAALGLNTVSPGLPAMQLVNCGKSLAKMGLLKYFLPGTGFQRVVVTLNTGIANPYEVLNANRVYNLVGEYSGTQEILLPVSGVSVGDQFDFSTEGNATQGLGPIHIIDQAEDESIVEYASAADNGAIYFTAIYNGINWQPIST